MRAHTHTRMRVLIEFSRFEPLLNSEKYKKTFTRRQIEISAAEVLRLAIRTDTE